MKLNKEIILASSSLFRFNLLTQAGIRVSRETSKLDERQLENQNFHLSADELSLLLARGKAKEVGQRFPDKLIIGCDQILSCEGKIYHKVTNKKQAYERLTHLSGKKHYLYTSIALYGGRKIIWQYTERPSLTMHNLTPEWIENYLQKAGEDIFKTAGIYQIEGQGIRLFKNIKGDYHAIIGLPLLKLLNFLRKNGIIYG